MAEKKILVLFDTLAPRREVLSYAVELANRLEADIQILVLLRWGSAGAHGDGDPDYHEGEMACKGNEEGNMRLERWFDKNLGSRVRVSGTIRCGDQASELLKVLAENPPFEAVVWGGNERFLRQKGTPVRGHWLERVRQELGCPLVVPSLKGNRGFVH